MLSRPPRRRAPQHQPLLLTAEEVVALGRRTMEAAIEPRPEFPEREALLAMVRRFLRFGGAVEHAPMGWRVLRLGAHAIAISASNVAQAIGDLTKAAKRSK